MEWSRVQRIILVVVFVHLGAVNFAWGQSGIENGLIGYWPMDEDGGNVTADESINDNSGNLQGNVDWTAGKFDSGLQFDGFSGYVNCGKSAELKPSSALSVSAWVNVSDYSSYAGIVSNVFDSGPMESGYTLSLWSIERLTFGAAVNNGFLTYLHSTSSNADQWYHLVGTFDGSTSKFYVDGQPVASASASSPVDYDPPPMYGLEFGRFADDNEEEYFSGIIDDVGIWDRALNAGEVSWLYGDGEGHAIPEPCTVSILALGALAIARKRSRQATI